VGRGLATGDLDNDGAVDVVAVDYEGPVLVLMNRAAAGRSWLSVRLAGARSNRMAIGARVRVTAGSESHVRECQTAGSYLSANDPRVHFGLGNHEQVDVEVGWPSGKTTRRDRVKVNQILTIREE
jgi:hypothetical protein